ncbi:hypothetical protein OHA91_39385 (plasmid) [Streptomyces erythrochromogenes]|uniref:Uncharacterized protein n=1 Tax=Streptomyces erythrochromogenes TaxID=285574 RepID=A0ABZ1QQJ2_9ACTN|nr:hypothetical protein [Streptomyces erythrochromogenes]
MYAEIVALLRATLPEFLGSLSAALAITAGSWTVRRSRNSSRSEPTGERQADTDLAGPVTPPEGHDAQ